MQSPAGRASFILGFNLRAYPAGAYFCAYKSRQNTLGALPQDPGRLQCWIRIEFRWEPKINPYCAQNRSQSSLRQHLPLPPCGARKNLRTIRLLDFFDCYGFSASLHLPPAALGSESPHPLSRWRERGPDGLASAGRQFGARGMLGLAEGESRGGWGAGL